MTDDDLDEIEKLARHAHPKATILTPRSVLALITRLRAAEARSAWQPIETAPPGQRVLLWVARGCGEHGATVGVVGLVACLNATHWQPLPAPSASEAPRG